ncbi:Uncharacterised protein [Streptococcus pneumoniae]|nr:Uncharacterised protein [Streptococcus pneumoniae]
MFKNFKKIALVLIKDPTGQILLIHLIKVNMVFQN